MKRDEFLQKLGQVKFWRTRGQRAPHKPLLVLLGAWPGRPENFLIATGASGHGLQHAPAAGRALSELILDRRYTAIDLTRFGCERVVENRPDPERGFTA